jgi:hypothetical protein
MTLRTLVLAAALLGLSAAPAAAIDHQAAMSSAALKFEWEGQPQISHGAPLYNEDARTAIPCSTPAARPCETALFKVEEAGKLILGVDGEAGTGGTTDVDAYLYKSDAAGTQGEKLQTAAASGPDTVSVGKAVPGFYLLVIDYYHGYNSGYKGVAKFTPSAPVIAAPPAPVTIPAVPVAAPAQEAKTAPAKKKPATCASKAKKIKSAKKRKAAVKRCARKSRKR